MKIWLSPFEPIYGFSDKITHLNGHLVPEPSSCQDLNRLLDTVVVEDVEITHAAKHKLVGCQLFAQNNEDTQMTLGKIIEVDLHKRYRTFVLKFDTLTHPKTAVLPYESIQVLSNSKFAPTYELELAESEVETLISGRPLKLLDDHDPTGWSLTLDCFVRDQARQGFDARRTQVEYQKSAAHRSTAAVNQIHCRRLCTSTIANAAK